MQTSSDLIFFPFVPNILDLSDPSKEKENSSIGIKFTKIQFKENMEPKGFSHLPVELLNEIFSYFNNEFSLRKTGLICKAFYCLSRKFILKMKVKNVCQFILKNSNDYDHVGKLAIDAAQKCKKDNFNAKFLDEITILQIRGKDLKKENLPSGISLLHNLRSLDLCANELTDLPRELVQLDNLICISLIGNKFTRVPSIFLYKFKILNSIQIANNPIDLVPVELKHLISGMSSNCSWTSISVR